MTKKEDLISIILENEKMLEEILKKIKGLNDMANHFFDVSENNKMTE